MITKTEAVETSREKWGKVLEVATKDVIDWALLADTIRGNCGFCEFLQVRVADDCVPCPLYSDICATWPMPYPSLYWRIRQKVGREDSNGLIPLIEQMIEAIDTRGKAWIEGGKI